MSSALFIGRNLGFCAAIIFLNSYLNVRPLEIEPRLLLYYIEVSATTHNFEVV